MSPESGGCSRHSIPDCDVCFGLERQDFSSFPSGGNRWELFSNEELAVIWDELRQDDGISYSISERYSPTEYALAKGIYDEAKRRILFLRDLDVTLAPLDDE